MATSGITTTELSRDSIISAAMRKIGALSQGQTPNTEELFNATTALNNLVAEYMTIGMPLWARKETNITMVANQSSYTIGVGQAVNTAFPLKIIQAWNYPSSGARQPMEPISLYDFNLLPTNGSTGTPVQFSYQPFINYGVLKLWPTPGTDAATNRTLTIAYHAPFDTFVDDTDTPYFPREWNNALIYGLAALLAPEFGLSLNDRASIEKDAEKHLNIALDFGLENAPVTFAPDLSWK